MAGIALKRSVRPCFHNGPSRSVVERKTKQKFQFLSNFVVFGILVIYIGAVFLILKVFKEFVLDLMFKTVNVIGRF